MAQQSSVEPWRQPVSERKKKDIKIGGIDRWQSGKKQKTQQSVRKKNEAAVNVEKNNEAGVSVKNNKTMKKAKKKQ
jgi:hypothetical protein